MSTKHSPVSVEEEDLRALKTMTHEVALADSQKIAYTGSGHANSPFRTRGLDFQEIRAYQPGDDIRQIDWRTTAKHGKPFTKLYTDEKERPVYFVCDLRTRMKFASHGDFKSVVAARMTMLLAWMVERKKDRIGSVILMPHQIKSVDMRGNGGTEALIADLLAGGRADEMPEDTTTLLEALTFLAREARSGAMIFICSDFSDFSTDEIRILNRLSTRRTIALIHIYDEMESQMPYGFWTVTDGHMAATVDMTNKSVRSSFEQEFQDRVTMVQSAAERNGWGYLRVQTTDDYLNQLIQQVREGGV